MRGSNIVAWAQMMGYSRLHRVLRYRNMRIEKWSERERGEEKEERGGKEGGREGEI